MGQRGTGVHRYVWTIQLGMQFDPGVSEKSVFEQPHVQLRGHSVWTASPGSQKHGSCNGSRALHP